MAKHDMKVCPVCKEQLHKDEAIKQGNRYYHSNCLEEKQKKDEEKKQGKKSNDYKDLIDYICKKYRLRAPSGMIMKQIKEYKDQYEYTYKGMELALRYFYDVLDNPIYGDGVGIIPYIYEEAKEQYIRKIEIKKKVEKENMTTEERVVYIQPQKRKNKKIIDISSI